MNKEEFNQWWRKTLDDLGLSERQAAAILGTTQQNINQKAKAGTIRFVDVQNILEAHQKTLTVKDKENS